MVYTCELSREERRLIDAVVDAGLAGRQHAAQVVKRGERLVIDAWRRELAARAAPPATPTAPSTTSTTWTTPAADPAAAAHIEPPEQLELFTLEVIPA